jgi:hypothetical protein
MTFDTLVGGHLTRLGTRNDVIVQKDNDLENAATKANQEILFSKVAQQVGHFDNPWLLFSKYIDAVNEKCTQTVLPKWESKLGGAGVFMSTHCFSMSEAERVDPTLRIVLLSTNEKVSSNRRHLQEWFSSSETV